MSPKALASDVPNGRHGDQSNRRRSDPSITAKGGEKTTTRVVSVVDVTGGGGGGSGSAGSTQGRVRNKIRPRAKSV